MKKLIVILMIFGFVEMAQAEQPRQECYWDIGTIQLKRPHNAGFATMWDLYKLIAKREYRGYEPFQIYWYDEVKHDYGMIVYGAVYLKRKVCKKEVTP